MVTYFPWQLEWNLCYLPLKESGWGFCCLPPDRVKLSVNSKNETNSRLKMSKVSRLLLFTPWKSQTNSEQQERISWWAAVVYPWQSQTSVIYPLKESKWDKGHCGLLLFTPWQSETSSEQQEKQSSMVKMGKGSRWASVIYPLKKSKWGLLLFTPWQSQTNCEQ